MSKSYESHYVSVVCPFFVGKERSRITCEGLASGSSMSMAFASPAECNDWKTRYCSSDYKTCPFTGLLNDKWDKILEQRH